VGHGPFELWPMVQVTLLPHSPSGLSLVYYLCNGLTIAPWAV
jgi:hypothetical protein